MVFELEKVRAEVELRLKVEEVQAAAGSQLLLKQETGLGWLLSVTQIFFSFLALTLDLNKVICTALNNASPQ